MAVLARGENVSKHFYLGRTKVQVLDDINLE